MRRFYTFLLLLITQISFATTFYVSGELGNNSNNGLSEENPFLTIQTAADLTQPGDTVFIMDGVYTNDNMYNVFSIVNWGEQGAWITYTALPGHHPKLKFNSFDGIGVFGACYVEISGLEIQGANDETTLDFALENRLNLQVAEVRGRGIAVGPANGIDPHHIKLLNNKIYKCGGSGIHTYLTDYMTIENNEVYECGWYSSLQESGIHLIQNRDSDLYYGVKNFVRNNYVHANFTYVPSIYDNTFYNGDGILIDDSRHVYRNTNIPSYQGITLIENNITFNNGGSGIYAFQSDNVWMINNTAYKNSMNPGFESYQFGAALSGGILIHNNIIVTQENGAPYGCFDCNSFDGDYNLLFNTDQFPFLGDNDITGEDPLFMNPSSDPNVADFSLLDGSPAQNAASINNAASHDFFGNRRKTTPDLGAIERFEQTRSDCEAGAVFGTADKTVFFICSTSAATNNLEFFNSSSSQKDYTYIITDTLDRVLAINETTYDFESMNSGLFFVYGVSFEGELNLSVGENLNTLSSTGNCFDISENHLQIYKEDMAGGFIATIDGETEVNVIVDDTIPDLILLQQDISTNLPVVYFLTDEAGFVLAFNDNGFEMEGIGEGTYFVGAAVYTGNLILQNDIHINLQAVSDDCYTYAFNFVKIINQSITELPPPPPPVLDGGEVRILGSQSNTDLCLGETTSNELAFAHTTTSTAGYAYVVTDEADKIVYISTVNNIDFVDFTCSTCWVGGVSYTGEITAQIGDELSNVVFSDESYDISLDRIQVNRILTNGGRVSTTDGEFVVDIITTGDETVDLVEVTNNITLTGNYVYLLTDTAKVILEIYNQNSFDFNELADGNYFIHGLNYSGSLTAEIGKKINSHILSDGCFALSNSAVQINRTTLEVIVDGGQVSILGGQETADLCLGETVSSKLIFDYSTTSTAEYAYVITDEAGKIVEISTENSIDFADLNCSTCMVGGVSYTGEIIAEIGDAFSDIVFSDGTYNVSEDQVQVNRIQVNAGLVSTIDGRFVVDITTTGDEMADLIEVTNNTNTTEKYAYLLTDTEGIILEVIDQNLFNFNEVADGSYFIYGLNYAGKLTAEIGEDINEHQLADGCYALSEFFIQVNRTTIELIVDGGQVTILGGQETTDLCLGQTASSELTFDYSSVSTEAYVYVITDEADKILEISTENSIDFAGLNCNTCMVGGVSYTGEITAKIGDELSDIVFSDGVYNISDDQVQVNLIQIDGGEISTTDGQSNIDIVTRGDETVDLIRIINTATVVENYAYLLTDTAGVILDIVVQNIFNFNTKADGSYFIYGLNYTGILTADVGKQLNNHLLADGCFALSNSAIQINRTTLEVILDGGQVSIVGGEETADLCLNTTTSNELTFAHTTISTAKYAYVVTDETGKIVEISIVNNIDFADLNCSTCMVDGVSYTGAITAEIGDDLSTIAFSDGTYNVSEDQVQVNRILTDGGEISTADGQSSIDITTIGDETVDLIEVVNTVTDAENYVYLLTNMEGVILDIVFENRFDFNKIGTGSYLIYGLNYAGNLTAEIGRDMDEHPLADDCFALSNSTIQVNRTTLEVTVDGGQIALTTEQLAVTLCVGGGRNEFISVEQNSNGVGDQYKFIIIDEDNRLLEIMQTDSTSFEAAVDGVCFIKGVSYAGTILAKLGDNLDNQPFASGNYAFSQNEIEITRIGVDGGRLTTTTGEIEVSFCEDDDVSDVMHLEYSTTSEKPYALTVIDGEGNLLEIVDGTTVDFSKYPKGFYFIRGVSYTGDIFIELGQDQSMIPFSTGCFNHSNSVQVYWVGTSDNCLTSLNNFDQYQFEMRLSPNPAQDYVRIEFDSPLGDKESGVVEIYNFNGQLIQQQPIQAWSENNAVDIDINGYLNGIYMAKIQLGNYWGYQKFVKGN